MPEDESLFEKLKADLGDEAEASALLPMVRKLARPIEAPSAGSNQALVELLRRELPRRQRRWQMHRALLNSQMRVIQRELWLASFMLMAIGVALTITQANSLVFAMIAPFIAAGGVAFLYNETDAAIEELENSLPTSSTLLLVTRLMLLFAFDLALALVGSLVLAVVLPGVSLLPLIEAWFAPMTFLTSVAFCLSIVLLDTFAALMFSLTLWAVHLLLRTRADGNVWLWVASLPGLNASETRPLLLLAAVALLASALLYRAERERYAKL